MLSIFILIKKNLWCSWEPKPVGPGYLPLYMNMNSINIMNV